VSTQRPRARSDELTPIIGPMSARMPQTTGSTSSRVPRSLIAVGLAALVLTSGAILMRPFGDHEQDRPNFVVIVTDDQRWDTLEAMPAVQRLLVDRGMTFTSAFTTTPSCCPSRVSLLTGRYSHHTGVFDGSAGNAPGGAPAFDDGSSLATWLDASGYRTGLVGKYLNDYDELPTGYIPPGWDEWFAIAQPGPQIRYYDFELNENGKIVKYGVEPSQYSTTVLQEKAVRFIEADEPFFLYFAPIAPHPPSTPAPADVSASVDLAWGPPPSFDEADVSDKPGGGPPPLSARGVAHARSRRLEMIRSLLAVDRAVEAIVDAVAATGRMGNTYFLFTSDNGFLWGEHRRFGKVWPYEESIRVPLVIRVPGGRTARTVEEVALNIDIAPTIMDLAGAEPGLPPDGISLVPLFEGDRRSPRDRFLVEFLGYAPHVPPYVALRTKRFLYVEYRNGGRELYDLRTDPFELRNLFGDRRRGPPATLVARLRESLRILAQD
jgi:N-acetylglucosamine-6-sulfatase